MKKIFLTGSSGLLGSNIYNLLKRKYKIIRISNDKKYKKNKKIIYCNFKSTQSIKNIIKQKGIADYFIHAGWGRINEPNSTYHLKENFQISKNLIKEFYDNGLNNFIFIGTINEYGDNKGCVKENSKPKGKLRNYEQGKLLFGLYGATISRKLKKNFIHIRLANLYGPIKKKNSLIYSIHEAQKRKENLHVSALDFYRDYLHSSDAALGVKKILERCKSTNIINLGSGKKIYMRRFAKIYWNIINKSDKLIIFNKILKKSTYKGYYLNNSSLKKITGWRPKNTLLNRIRKNIKMFKV
jgi:nucleoside-diphosphate-sugar epimerase